jgi:SnoaL-like domain
VETNGTRHAAAVTEITQLVLHERQGRDRGWWTQMEQSFHPDASVFLSWLCGDAREFIEGSKAMFAAGTRPVHRLSPPVVHLSGDRAVVEVPAAIEVRGPLEGVETDLASYTRLLYQVQRDDGKWLIRGLTCIYERDTLAPTVPGETISLDLERLDQFRIPYRYLAYHLSAQGRSVRDGLYGDDEPERVGELYAEVLDWMRHG